MKSVVERDSVQIVRPLRHLESVPEYPMLIDMLIPKYCPVVFFKPVKVKESNANYRERCKKGWEMRKLLTSDEASR